MDFRNVITPNYKEKADNKIPNETEIDFEEMNPEELKKLGRQVED